MRTSFSPKRQPSGENPLHNPTMHISQAVLAPLELVGESLVMDPHEMQDGCLKIVYMDRILGDVESKFIGGAMHVAGLHAAARHPKGEPVGMVIASPEFPFFKFSL